jgi:hypothetical protein
VTSLKLHLFALVCILASLSSQAWAQTSISFGQTQTGTISAAAQSNSYTLGGTVNDVVDFTMVTTSGSLVPKISLYTPAGKLLSSSNPYACEGSTVEMNTVQIPATGTYTVDASDCSSTNTGDYALYVQRTNNPGGATPDSYGQMASGEISWAAQSNTYTFSANLNDVVDFTMTTTNGSLSPKIRLYEPNGSLLSSANPYACEGSTLEMNTVQIPAAGTYTVLVGDCSDTNSGDYDLYLQQTDNPTGTPNLPFGQTQTGTISASAQSNTYTFSANANDVVDFTMTASGLSPKIRLYGPSGALLSSANPYACEGSTVEMNTVTLPATGDYTVLVGDCSDTLTGSYLIYAQRTNNPAGATNLPFGQVQTGLIGSAAQSNTFTFADSANDVVDFTMVTTSGSVSPKIRLYQPNGSLVSSANPYACEGPAVEMNTVTLPATGVYTVLAGDCSDTATGNYALYAQSVTNPFGPTLVLWGQVQSGTIGSVAQSNTYNFSGTANDTIDLTVVTTSGNLSPKIRLYNPNGTLLSSNNPYACEGSTAQLSSVTLAQTGNYTVLVGDCGDTNTGNYNLSSQCFGTCAEPETTLSLSAAPTFPSEPVGITGPPQTVTVTNTGTNNLAFSAITISGPFAIVGSGTTCSTSTPVAASGSCKVAITFTPTVVGTNTGGLSFTDNASPSTQTVNLTGTGTASVPTVSLSAPPTFPAEPVGTTSPAQTVTLTNTSSATLTFTAITVSEPFAMATSGTTCSTSTSFAAGSCTVALTFTPTAAGTNSGSLTFTDNANPPTQTVSLSGTGNAPEAGVSSSSLTFTALMVKSTSNPQAVTLSNTGNMALSVAGITISGDFAQTNNCGSSVAAGGSCTINVTFAPTAGGSRTGALTITDNNDNSTGSTQTVALTGTGMDFTLTTSTSTASVSQGQSATYTVSVGAVGGFNQAVGLTCTDPASESACTISPSSQTPGSTATVTVTTTAPSHVPPRTPPAPRRPWPQALPVLALLLAWFARAWCGQPARTRRDLGRSRASLRFPLSFLTLPSFVRRRESGGPHWRSIFLRLAASVALTVALAACGGGGGTPVQKNPGTTTGNYTLTITGTVGSGSTADTHTLPLTLTVN